MGTKRASRRLRKIKNGIIQIIWLPVLGLLLWVVYVVWGEISSKYVGYPIVNTAEKILTSIFPIVGNWIFNHPDLFAFILMCLTVSIVTVLVFWETRDPKGISASKDEKRIDGVSIHNNSGDDLINCLLYLSSLRKVL